MGFGITSELIDEATVAPGLDCGEAQHGPIGHKNSASLLSGDSEFELQSIRLFRLNDSRIITHELKHRRAHSLADRGCDSRQSSSVDFLWIIQ